MQSLHRARDAVGGRAHGADQPTPRMRCLSAASPSPRDGASWSDYLRAGTGPRRRTALVQPAHSSADRRHARASGASWTDGSRHSMPSLPRAARSDVTARRLLTIPGIGTLNATALVAAVGNAADFARGRDLAAWLGLVPRQATTGGRPRLLGITKRGNKYLRKMLIHGARAALPIARHGQGRSATGCAALSARAHQNTVVVALASKLARIAWSVLRPQATYRRHDGRPARNGVDGDRPAKRPSGAGRLLKSASGESEMA